MTPVLSGSRVTVACHWLYVIVTRRDSAVRALRATMTASTANSSGGDDMTHERSALRRFRIHHLGETQAQFGVSLGETGICKPASEAAVRGWERGEFGVAPSRRRAMATHGGITLHKVNRMIDDDVYPFDEDDARDGLSAVNVACLPRFDSADSDFIGLVGMSGSGSVPPWTTHAVSTAG